MIETTKDYEATIPENRVAGEPEGRKPIL